MKLIKTTLIFFVFIFLTACIGTDLVDTPLAPKAAYIEFEPTALTLIESDTTIVTGTVYSTDGSILDLDISWISRNESVGTVDQSGKVRAVSKGQAWIVAEVENIADSLLLTVVQDSNEVATVEINADQNDIEVGEELQLNAVVKNVAGDEIIGGSVIWSSSADAIATVDNQGLVTGISEGTASITATSEGVQSEPFTINVGGMAVERTGTFSGLNGYSASGTAVLRVEGDDKSLIFESDFSTQNGPGLFIYLSPSGDSVTGGISLGAIKSTSGMQTYEIPSSEDTDQYQFVIIYCQPFGVLFGNAELQ